MGIKDVFVSANGMVAVFDRNGMQVPELQGVIFEVMEKIGKHADEYTLFHFPSFGFDVSWYFKERRR